MRIGFILILAFFTQWAYSSPSSLTYQGRIVKSDGTPLEHSNVAFIFQITNPSGLCVIYQEQVTGVNMSGTKGVFDVPIGSGAVSWPNSGGFTVLDAFNNSSNFSCGACSGYSCVAGTGSYGPMSDDGRVLKVQFHDGDGWRTISPNTVIRSVPFAGYSLSAQKLGQHDAGSFVLKNEINSNTSCGGGQFLTWNATTKTFGCSGVSGASGGTVTTVTAASPLSVAAGTESSAPHITIQVASGSQAGYLSSADWTAFSNKLGTTTNFAGDVSGTASNLSVDKIKGVAVSASAMTSGDVLKYSGGHWVNGALSVSDIPGLSVSLAGKPDYSQFPTTCTAAQTLTFVSPVGGFSCTNIAISGSQVSGNISGTASGFTGSLSGDVTGTQAATVVGKLQGVGVSATAPTNNQVLKYNGSTWAPATLGSSDLPAGTLSGTGTVGYLSYYSAANTLANSLIFQSGTSIGVGTTTPNSSSVLDMSSSTKGFLPPRMTTAQRNGIASPAAGLMVYDSTENKLYLFNGSSWTPATDNASGIFQAKRSGNQTVPGTGALTRVVFNNKTVDPDSNYSSATGLYTVPQDGFYHFSASIGWDSVGNTGGGIRIRTTGGSTIGQSFSPGSGNAYYSTSGSYYLTSGQQVEVMGWQWNGSNANITLGDFSAFRVGSGGNGGGGGVADNLGNHTAMQNFVLGNHWLSGDGDDEGIRVSTAGNVGIGNSTPSEKLDVSGKVKATEFCLGSTCINTWPSGGGGMIDTAQITDGAVTQDKLATVSGLAAGTYGNATTIPSITVDTKGRIIAVTTNTVAALPAASGASGKFLKSNGTSWSGQDILFSDIKNSSGASAFNIGACGANQTVAWSSLTDSFTCQAIGNLAAEKITSGTLDAARLPSSVTNALWTESSGNVYRNSGNVGIGTTSPTAKLEIGGTAGVDGIRFPDGTLQTSAAVSAGGNNTILTNFPDALRCTTTSGSASVLGRENIFYLNIKSPSPNAVSYSWFGSGPTYWGLSWNADGSYASTYSAPAISDTTNCHNKTIAQLYASGQAFNFTKGVAGQWLEASGNVYRNTGNVGIGTTSPASPLTVAGVIESTSGGFKFPDGSIQTSAATTGAGGTWNTLSLSNTADFNPQCEYILNGIRASWVHANSIGAITNTVSGATTASWRIVNSSNKTLTYSADDNYNNNMYYGSAATISIQYRCGSGSTGQWTTNGSDAFYSAGKVGIGTTTPAAALDVAGEVKFGNTAATCNSSKEGQQRYNSSTKKMEYCDGSNWLAFSSQVSPVLTSAQIATGTVNCVTNLPSMTFQGSAGSKFEVIASHTARPDTGNTNGHHYINLFVDGARASSAGTNTRGSWRSTVVASYTGTLSTSGSHTVYLQLDCGNGITTMTDTGAEWPTGGLNYKVWVHP